MEPTLTVEEVAAKVGSGCGKATVRKAFRSGELAGMRLGRRYRFFERDVEAWLARLRKEADFNGPRIEAVPTARSAARRRT